MTSIRIKGTKNLIDTSLISMITFNSYEDGMHEIAIDVTLILLFIVASNSNLGLTLCTRMNPKWSKFNVTHTKKTDT